MEAMETLKSLKIKYEELGHKLDDEHVDEI